MLHGDELKSCPFCGGEAETLTAEHAGGYLFCIMCNDCRSRGDVYDTAAEAIAAWNTRVERTCEVESEIWHDHGGDGSDTYEYVLSCGHKVEWLDDDEEPKYCPRCGARVLRNTPKYSETDAKEVGE